MCTFRRSCSFLRRFSAEKKGNVAVIFASALLPIAATIGASVDYGNALNTRTKMQAALDAATIAGAKAYANTGNIGDAEAAARNHYQKSSGNAPEGQIDSFTVDPLGFVKTTASTNVETTFLKMTGLNEIEVGVDSKAAMSGKELELSIMLDVTGSMANDMDDLKDAGKDLLDIVLTRTQKERRVAIVPFAQAVNVGDDYFDAITGFVSQTDDPDGDGWKDGMPNNLKKPNKCPKWKWQKPWKYNKKCKKWEATGAMPRPETCVTERTQGNQYKSEDEPDQGQYFPIYEDSRHQGNHNNISSSCKPSDSKLLALTDDRTKLDDTIDSMQANGYTAGHLGTQFAWYTLSPNWNDVWPQESQAGAYNDDKLLKVAILMSDGEYNTFYSNGQGNSWQQAREICENMKAAGVEVYTIGFDMNPGNSTTTLQQCASSDEHYFFPYDGQALREVFRDIGARIAIAADGITLAE